MREKEYVKEFIEVLGKEISELKKDKNNIYKLKVLKLAGKERGRLIYRFETDRFFSLQENVVYRLSVSEKTIECEPKSCGKNIIEIALDWELSDPSEDVSLVLDKTFLPEKLKSRFENTLTQADSRYASAARIFNGSFKRYGKVNPDLSDYPKLNSYQAEAVVSTAQGDAIIWGPPGTGKTHTIAAAISEQIKMGNKVLLVSHANTAVDGAMEELAKLLKDKPSYKDGHLVRLGNSTLTEYPLLEIDNIITSKMIGLEERINELEKERIPAEERKIQLAAVLELKKEYKFQEEKVNEAEQKIALHQIRITEKNQQIGSLESRLAFQRQELAREEKRLFRSQSKIDGKKAAIENTSDQIREIHRLLIEEGRMLEQSQEDLTFSQHALLQIQEEFFQELILAQCTADSLDGEMKRIQAILDELSKEIGEIQTLINGLHKKVLEEAHVIGTTLSKSYVSNELNDLDFDVLFIDEISMAPLFPVFYAIGMVKKQSIFIGDFLQLPPIASSTDKRVKEWQKKNIFHLTETETVEKARSSSFVKPLSIQYRMNPAIAALPNALFYGGILENGSNTHEYIYEDSISGTNPLVMIDTAAAKSWTGKGPGGKSRYNAYHAQLSVKLALEYVKSDPEVTVGIVVPYRPQKDLTGRMLDESLKDDMQKRSRIEVNTVHSFQGGEKHIIICDTVEGENVFFKWWFFDEVTNEESAHLMLNVAITRAKKKFILVADTAIVEACFKGKNLLSVISTIREKGVVVNSTDIDGGFFAGDETAVFKHILGLNSEELKHFNDVSFWSHFIMDLKEAKEEIVIFCPYVREGRIDSLQPHFEKAIEAGVKIIVYTRPVPEHEKKYQAIARKLIDELRRIHITVRMRGEMHEKVVIMDSQLIWEGSLNVLSHKSSKEQMIRISGKESVEELVSILDLNTYSKPRKRPAGNGDPSCKLCEGYMVIRKSEGSSFYGCSEFPNCGYTCACSVQE
ncbi:MAG: AAA domain-containing protein [Lacrimispora sp.]|uniref:AAA domain-containing protein n=1 Tax=Lacrimispora sp. TaxID=2719234 RepID=UPI0039E5E8F4